MREDLVCLDALLREGPLCADGRLLVVDGCKRAPERLVGLLSSRTVDAKAGSERSFGVIDVWLARCLTEHMACGKWDSQDVLGNHGSLGNLLCGSQAS